MSEVIEIAEVLEDTVVSVHHLSPPRPRSDGWALAAGAAVGIVVFFVAAALAVGVAADNHAALKAFLDGGGAPIDFHARRISPFVGVALVSGLCSGLAFAALALWRRAGARRATSFRAADGTVIVSKQADGWRFTPSVGMTGEPTLLGQGARVRATLGPVSYVIASVSAPREAAGVGRGVDRRSLGYAAASATAHAVLVALFFLVPATASGYASDELGNEARRLPVRIFATEDPKHELPKPGDGGAAGGEAVTTNAREKGQAGELGKPDSTAENAKAKSKRTQEQPSVARPTEEQARSGGALGYIRAHEEVISSVTSTADMSSGLDEETIRGGWLGDRFGEQRGYGSAPDGRGPGGGGHEPGTIGTGPLRTPYTAMRLPPGTLPGRRVKPTFEIGHADVPEGVDKNMIRRYVRQKRAEITYCYEKELAVRPGLSGTATTAFTIDDNGRVITVKAGGLGVTTVERCVESVIKSIQFPKGQTINVTAYPFTFHPVGA